MAARAARFGGESRRAARKAGGTASRSAPRAAATATGSISGAAEKVTQRACRLSAGYRLRAARRQLDAPHTAGAIDRPLRFNRAHSTFAGRAQERICSCKTDAERRGRSSRERCVSVIFHSASAAPPSFPHLFSSSDLFSEASAAAAAAHDLPLLTDGRRHCFLRRLCCHGVRLGLPCSKLGPVSATSSAAAALPTPVAGGCSCCSLWW